MLRIFLTCIRILRRKFLNTIKSYSEYDVLKYFFLKVLKKKKKILILLNGIPNT